MPAVQMAAAHQAEMEALGAQVAVEARALWAVLDVARLDLSWARIADRMLALLTGAQALAAATADPYTDRILTAQRIDPAAVGGVRSGELAGVASDGRPLPSLLYQPVIQVKTLIGAGTRPRVAMVSGLLSLDTIVRTQVADAGRVAAGVSLTARPAASGYTRMVVGRTCGRCIVLAGRRYEWNAGFLRHPRCDCVHIPTREDIAGSVRTDPALVFKSMTPAEQDRAFGKAGAAAIREGADIGQVVNARKGMYTAGGLDYTRTSTTRRGQTAGRARLMPEAIYKIAKGDRDEAIRLLRLHRFIL